MTLVFSLESADRSLAALTVVANTSYLIASLVELRDRFIHRLNSELQLEKITSELHRVELEELN